LALTMKLETTSL